MPHGSGNIVTAADFNALAASINEVLTDSNSGATSEATANYGYGQTPAVASVAVGESITAAHWTSLFGALDKCATHQGTASITPSLVGVGDLIDARNPFNLLTTEITNIRSNRLNVDVAQTTTTTNGAFGLSSRTTAWTTPVSHVWDVTFADWNKARHFFNSGGQIRISATRTGGTSSAQNTSISNMLTAMGTIMFDHTQTTKTGAGGTATSIGFYNLTGTNQTIFSHVGSGGYTGDTYTLSARLVGTAGTTGTIRFTAVIAQTTDVPSDVAPDGILTSLVDTRRATGGLTIAAPSYTAVTLLSEAGGGGGGGGGGGPTAPGTPTIGVPSSITNTQIVFPVTVGAGTLPTSYKIYYKRSGATAWIYNGAVSYTGSPQTVTVSGLNRNTAYSIRVVASNAYGDSGEALLHRITTGSTWTFALTPGLLSPYSYPDNLWADWGYSRESADAGYSGVPIGSITGSGQLPGFNSWTVEALYQTGSNECVFKVRGPTTTQDATWKKISMKVTGSDGIDTQRTVYSSDATYFATGLGTDLSVSTWVFTIPEALEIYNLAGGTFDVMVSFV